MVETYYAEGVVTNGSFYIDIPSPSSLSGVCSISFFNDVENEIFASPTSGTVTFEISEDGYNYGEIDQGTITYPLQNSYNRPSFIGYCRKAKFTLNNITDANYYVAKVHMSEG